MGLGRCRRHHRRTSILAFIRQTITTLRYALRGPHPQVQVLRASPSRSCTAGVHHLFSVVSDFFIFVFFFWFCLLRPLYYFALWFLFASIFVWIFFSPACLLLCLCVWCLYAQVRNFVSTLFAYVIIL